MDVLEQYQVEILIEQLQKKFPEMISTTMIESLKKSLCEKNQDFSLLALELDELLKGDQKKLETFLEKYLVNYEYPEKFKIYGRYSIEQLKEMTDGMTEEEIRSYLMLHGLNPGQITMFLLQAKEEKREVETKEEWSPQSLIVKKPKMAAFVNILTITFLVGMVSGIATLIVFRLVLHALY